MSVTGFVSQYGSRLLRPFLHRLPLLLLDLRLNLDLSFFVRFRGDLLSVVGTAFQEPFVSVRLPSFFPVVGVGVNRFFCDPQLEHHFFYSRSARLGRCANLTSDRCVLKCQLPT